MSKRKITPQQIVTALRRIELALAQGAPARTAIRHAGISSAAYYRWRDEYGGMNADQVQRLMELKKKNAQLTDQVEKLSRVVVWNPEANAASLSHGGSQRAERSPYGRSARGKSAKP